MATSPASHLEEEPGELQQKYSREGMQNESGE